MIYTVHFSPTSAIRLSLEFLDQVIYHDLSILSKINVTAMASPGLFSQAVDLPTHALEVSGLLLCRFVHRSGGSFLNSSSRHNGSREPQEISINVMFSFPAGSEHHIHDKHP